MEVVFIGNNVSWKEHLINRGLMMCDVECDYVKVKKHRYAIARELTLEYSNIPNPSPQADDVYIQFQSNHVRFQKGKDYSLKVQIQNKSHTKYTILEIKHMRKKLYCSQLVFPSNLESNGSREISIPVQFDKPKTNIYILVLVLQNVETGEKCFATKTALFFFEGDFHILKHRLSGEPINERKLLDLLPSSQKLENQKKSLTPSNYYEKLKLLLCEEMDEQLKEVEKFNTKFAKLTYFGGLYRLKIPDLTKKNASILKGCYAIIDLVYRGVVEDIKNENLIITFTFSVRPQLWKSRTVNVSFSLNSYKWRMEHQALKLALDHEIISYLFPQNHGNNPLIDINFNYFNGNIKGNDEQEQAIRHIFWKTAYPAPYIIFGPPGTGKTSTIVEIIKQIWFLKIKEKILVCASSNNAANEIACRLTDCIPNKDLLRYLAQSYQLGDLPVSLKAYCNYIGNRFYEPSLDELYKYQIVVSTVVNAGRLVNADINPEHFAYVFIDECGSCTETESLIPIAGILSSSSRQEIYGQIVLSGDPYQLGPVISSPLAMEHGFGISMLERLMNDDFYCKGPDGQFNKKVLTKLVRNFRSHPKMLGISNKLFYDNELIACGNDVTNMFLNWKKLKNPAIPIIFHHLKGRERREANSPSWFNMIEVSCTVKYIGVILNKHFNGTKIKQTDIGVISPYSKQCFKLKKRFLELYWKDIEVGSIEQYQGREKLVTILSTVRSNNQHLKKNHKSSLGFLNNPKRFNVAMTRAMALQIVIGDASLLKTDPTWNHLIQYCIDNNCIVGELKSIK